MSYNNDTEKNLKVEDLTVSNDYRSSDTWAWGT
jgi:hypothetical protein